MRTVYLVILLLMIMSAPLQAARIDTAFEFSTLETTHFSIHFHQGVEEIAQKAALMAEEAHLRLSASFPWEPREKTEMVLIDDTDFTNGFATPLPYNTIYLKIVPPSLVSTLGEYEDWLKVLIIHEYTHILTSDPARGYSTVMRNIFGKPTSGMDILSFLVYIASTPPNTLLPRWWHEGMATWSETEYTRMGRGRSSYYEMILRSAVAEHNLPDIDMINGDLPAWPSGHMPYIFGLRLQKYIVDTYGKDAPGKLASAHAGRFPYFINGAPSGLLDDKDYKTLYREMIEDLTKEQMIRIDTLQRLPFTATRVVSDEGENLLAPRYSPDGASLAFTRHDAHGHARVMITSRDGKEPKGEFRRQQSDEMLSWSPDGAKIYFSQAEINREFNTYQDLYSYDLRKDEIRRLTNGLRISEPEMSPNGATFAMVMTDRGSQNLALLDADEASLDTPKPRLITSYKQMRVSSPRWSPDSRQIAFTLTDNNGKTSILVYDLQRSDSREIISNGHTVAYPVWSKDGSYLLYAGDETGVVNLYAYLFANGQSIQVSHVMGGALQADISPDGKSIVFADYGSHGFRISSIDNDRSAWLSGRSPSIMPYWHETMESQQPAAAPGIQVASETVTAITPHRYSPWKTLLPHFWLPRIVSDSDTSVAIGAYTAGQDVLGYNTYLLSADYSSRYKRGYFDVTYQNDYFYPTLSFEGYARPTIYSSLRNQGSYSELNQGLVLEASVPFSRIESSYRFRFGYHLQDRSTLYPKDGTVQTRPSNVFEGRQDNLYAGISYSGSLKYPFSISPEEGRELAFTYKYYSRDIGSDIDSREYLASYSEYLGMPSELLRHHVINLKLAGAAATGNQTVQQAFNLGGAPSAQNLFPLRGYADNFETGTYIATGSLEYRAPVRYFLRGIGTWPLFFDRLHAAFFIDAGEAWDDRRSFKVDNIKTGIGSEIRCDITLGYYLTITPAIGIAYGLNKGGGGQIYFSIGANL